MEKEEVIEFIHNIEKLKDELRHNWTSKDRKESVAEHSWRMSVMALLMEPKLKTKINLLKALKMISIHDLGEIEAGDVPAFMKKEKREQEKIEKESMGKLRKKYKDDVIDEIVALWEEYEERKTPESKFVKALDKLEVRIQHNESDIKRWNSIEFPRSQYVADKYCDYEPFLKEFNELVKKESKEKIRSEEHT